ncbi:MAG: TRAP transporter substrate-binding protein DctP [Arenimonas sp.]|nr:TRAP transporter substrate-binding protein DctP [Arenimonas sp.]
MKSAPALRRLLAGLLLACLAAPATAQVIKIATLAPDGSAWMREVRAAAAEVKQGTGGRVEVKYFPGGVMGNDAVVLRKLRLGQLQGGVLTSSELSLVYRDTPVYGLPFLLDGWEQVPRLRAELDPIMAKGFKAKGIHLMGVSDVGFAYLMGDRPLRTQADMSGIKLWIPQNDEIATRTFKRGGINAIPLPIGDVFTSLQTGLVDTVVNTPSGAVALQWHGKVKHMVDLPLTFVVGFMVIDERTWAKVSPADQPILDKAFSDAARRMDANVRRDDVSALAAMKKQGLVVAPLDPAESARWRAVGAEVSAQMEADGTFSPEVMAAVRRALAAPKVP